MDFQAKICYRMATTTTILDHEILEVLEVLLKLVFERSRAKIERQPVVLLSNKLLTSLMSEL
jgi:hypothetical protein